MPPNFHWTATAPPSKSVGQRLIAATILHPQLYTIHRLGDSLDELAALNIVQSLGAKVYTETPQNDIIIDSRNIWQKSDYHIDCGESGLCARLFGMLCSSFPYRYTITGHRTLMSRDMSYFSDFFTEHNISYELNHNKLPLSFMGGNTKNQYIINASSSSQYLTGLIYGLSATANQPIEIQVIDPVSIPYIHLTIHLLNSIGYPVTYLDDTIYISPHKGDHPSHLYNEGCWSSASYILAAGALYGSAKVSGLDVNSAQADRAILDVLRAYGAIVDISGDTVSVVKQSKNPFHFDATHCPDLIPILAVLAAMAPGQSRILGAKRLINKESNRAHAIVLQWHKLGIKVEIDDEGTMTVYGNQINIPTSNIELDTYQDHRMAMSIAIMCYLGLDRVTILNPEVVRKSFPGFWDILSQALTTE